MATSTESRAGIVLATPWFGLFLGVSFNRFAVGIAFFEGEMEAQIGPVIFGVLW